ncbi:MAG TPA: fatty acyl-AMP ligase [Symbiobacteriaceae bacterium]|nr:fatty acyl-AMP ligase [Symbiobacteriaceae bacterium]
MTLFDPNYSTLVDVLRWRATNQPDKRAFIFLRNGEEEEAVWTYSELDRRARTVAAHLQAMGAQGQRALLVFPPGLDYVAAFMGCLYAGTVAVPIYPPHPKRPDPRFDAVMANANPIAALTTTDIAAVVTSPAAKAHAWSALHWVATDQLDLSTGDQWEPLSPDPNAIAFLQYTSGSTSNPKGVMISHTNLMHNERQIAEAMGLDENSVICGWVPLYHDLGLIGNVLQSLYLGSTCVLMAPLAFLVKPMRWLEAISRYGAVFSAGPNFAYELCITRSTPEHVARLDLSRWQRAVNAAEPVRPETLARFAQTFAPAGFRPEALHPCFGLAEATVFAAGGNRQATPRVWHLDRGALEGRQVREVAPDDPSVRPLVSCGMAPSGVQITIVNPETRTACAADQVGEVWIAGPNVAQGYWQLPDATSHTFGAYTATGEGPFMRTGDLGLLRDDEVYIVGRIKDLIIIRGQNHYPEDIEWTVQTCHPAIRPGGTAAFSDDGTGEEQLILVVETDRLEPAGVNEVIAAIRQALYDNHTLSAFGILLVKSRTIPKTSSGKVQRHATKTMYRNQTLPIMDGLLGNARVTPAESVVEPLV